MKKLLICSAIATALSANVQAQEKTKDNEKWVAGFVEYYSTDKAETGLPNFLDNGYGVGAEFGFKFTPEWAVRLEISRLNIDASPSDESGSRIGVDALYFVPNDLFYTFGGLKFTEINETDLMANIGIGKHWDVGNSLKIITEIAAYQTLDSGDSNTHLGYKLGLAYTFGMSTAIKKSVFVDSDNDGIFDKMDSCASTPIGRRVDNIGCALDSDNDGVLNTIDMCSDTPAGMKVNAKGCRLTLDQDQDGVLNNVDQCADTPMTDKVDGNGCGISTEKQVSTPLNVLFDNNRSVINNPDDAQFQVFADFMNRYPATDTAIEGHASAPGNTDYNMMMSQKRAEAIKTLLVNKYGIESVRITTEGLGETQLLDKSDTLASNKVNRRITAKVSASKRVKVER